MLAKIEKTLLERYEKTLKDVEDLENNLEYKSIKEIRNTLQCIVNRARLQVEPMFEVREAKEEKKYTKKEIQEHFNQMLNVTPITRVKKR
jgi:hypothetical protein